MKNALVILAAVSAAFAIEDPVRLDTGLVSGSDTATAGVRVYKGIPYAAPPVGKLRWRAPESAASWDGVRQAVKFSPVCHQARSTSAMSEDCLYLNVWTPARSARDRLPVMFWIHGGGLIQGAG